jgi:hypothetical protein
MSSRFSIHGPDPSPIEGRSRLSRARRAALQLVLVAGVLVATGCASLSKSECLAGDWVGIGQQDALAGWPPSRIGAHFEACSEYGVQPDPTRYEQGFAQGLVGYCTGPNGFDVGRFRHDDYYGQCPQQTEAAFLAGLELGNDVAALDGELVGLENRIRELQHEYDHKDTSADQRTDIRRHLSDLIHERDRRSADLERLVDRARLRGY